MVVPPMGVAEALGVGPDRTLLRAENGTDHPPKSRPLSPAPFSCPFLLPLSPVIIYLK